MPARTISLPEPPSDSISCLSFSTAEPLLACASWDGTVRAGSGPTLVRVNPNPSRNPNLNLNPNSYQTRCARGACPTVARRSTC